MIVPIILSFVAVLPLMFTSDPTSMMSGLMSGLTIFIIPIDMIVAIIFALVLYPALVNMGLYDSEIGAAFRFREVLERIKVLGWGSYILWIIAIIVATLIAGFVIGLIAFILSITTIGIIIAIPLLFLSGAYLTMFQARSIGLLFSESIE